MNKVFTFLTLSFLILSCQNEGGDAAVRPEFINFDAVENNVDAMTAGRKSEAYRAAVSLVPVGDEEIVVLAKREEDGESLAYVLQTDILDATPKEMSAAWVVYLQDHLLLFDEASGNSYHLAIGDRPLDSEVINESYAFSTTMKGSGLARYRNNTTSADGLRGAASYLATRQ